MGICNTKIQQVPFETPFLIVNVNNWTIIEASSCYEVAFGHNPVGHGILWIMTYFVRKTHNEIFNSYKNTSLDNLIKHANTAMNAHRYMVINNGCGTTSKVKMWIEYHTVNSVKMNIFPINCINQPQIPRNSLVNSCTLEPTYIMEDLPNRICIMMDLKNSTNLMNRVKLNDITKLYFEIAKSVDSTVCKKYHPYARIHETAGDSIFIVVDTQYKERCNMVLNMVSEIINKTNEILLEFPDVYFRCGIAIGDLRGGMIDGKSYRLFGSAINLASRLESSCERNKIVISSLFCESLQREGGNHDLNSKLIDCKGFDFPIKVCIYCIKNSVTKYSRRESFIMT